MSTREETRKFLEQRSGLIKRSGELIARTRELYDKFGNEMATSLGRFDELAKSMQSSQLRLAVLGEYSRGKSSLLNALLDMDQLPTAQQATTAINTFIYGLPEDRREPFIRINRIDGTQVEMPLMENGVSTLEKWGTELAADNRDARDEVNHIELYIDNDLLKNDLVLIDTPGMETIHAHHAEITKKAIDSAHMAIWVQSVQQLGGNRTEWEFLRDTLAKCFRKFITVINWWDLVLEPQDRQDREKSPRELEREKLDVVRRNFRDPKNQIPANALELLTSEDNLFGVSAKWAQHENAEKRQRSGIDKLFRRIRRIADSDEDREEIVYKPLAQLVSLQERLEAVLRDRLTELRNNDPLEKRRFDLEQLKMEIRGLELEGSQREQDAREDHGRLRDVSIREIEEDLAEPLSQLKEEIDALVTRDYVDDLIRRRVPVIDLPPDLKERYARLTSELEFRWSQQRKNIEDRLAQLNAEFSEGMNRYMGGLQTRFAALKMDVPKLEIAYNVDFAPLEEYYMHQVELENNYNSSQRLMEDLERELIAYIADDEAVRNARDALARAETRLATMGSRPAPRVSSKKVQTSSGGWYSSPKYKTVTHVDDSGGKAYDARQREYENLLANREKELERIQREEQVKKGERLTRERAIKKLEREMDRKKRELEELRRKAVEAETGFGERAYGTLVRNTAGQLDVFANTLKRQVVAGVRDLFDQNLEFLRQCVAEQIMETLNVKKNNQEEILALINAGEAEVEADRKNTEDALERLENLRQETESCLSRGI